MDRPVPRYQPDYARRPGNVTAIRGIAFQNDGRSAIGRLFIRPFEALDRWAAGLWPKPGAPPLAMHAGIHVTIDGDQDYVAEQLVGTFDLTFKNGLNWTPYDKFKARDRGGWDLTVPAPEFRRVDQTAVDQAIQTLNTIEGHPFLGEDCTAFIERAFNGRRLFADSPILRWSGVGARVGDPALPLLKPDANLDEHARYLLQFDAIKKLPDPLADAKSPNVRIWTLRLIPLAALAWFAGRKLGGYSSASRRSVPVSRTARRFLT
jgi:hypothetical protein